MANLNQNSILILSDHKVGTTNQCEALAQALDLPYEIVTISYSIFAKLPNFIPIAPFFRLSKSSKSKLKKLSLPNVKYLISGGRRLAPIAMELKKRNEGLKLVQIMNPAIRFDKFDLVVLPRHDGYLAKDSDNVIESIGALTKVISAKTCDNQFNDLFDSKATNIAVLLGGKSKSGDLDIKASKNLAKILSKIAGNMKANLIILGSRRTKDLSLKTLESNLSHKSKILPWDLIKDNNPYQEILKHADFFIVTGDSVSMISECCQNSKPVYIFDTDSISSKKHRKFHQNLYQENYARKLDSNIDSLIKFTPKKLDEAKKIAAIIKSRF